jgi:ribonuclease R
MSKIKEGEFYESEIEFMTNGNATVTIGEKEFFVYKKNTLNALHLDRVSVQIFKAGKKLEAKVVKVISRFKKEFVGKVQIGKKTVFVVPDSNKIVVDFYIKGGLKAEEGQKVLVEFIKWEGSKSPQAKIIKILGDAGDNNAEMDSIMYEYNLPVDFPEEVKRESEEIPETISKEEISKRLDLRNIITIGIDPHDSKDADDVIGLEILNNNEFNIYINIADVTHYIKPDSPIDKEAYNRGTSVYLVDRCIPMIPERLSNKICSLKSGSDKLCFSLIIKINKNGEVLKSNFHKTIINVNKDYTYEEAQEVIENGSKNDIDNVIIYLNEIAKKLREKRIKKSLEINTVEVKFKLSEDNKKPIGVYFKEQKEANKLIEEFMLLTNMEAAKFIKSKIGFCVNRSHPEPNITKLVELKNICDKLGHDFNISDDTKIKESINKLIKEVKETPEENFINSLIVRTQSKAYYTTENIGHYGLGFDDYAHFTSCIRRYSDLLVHRILNSVINQ